MSNIQSLEIEIAPEVAKQWLNHNYSQNRNLRPGVVNKYALAMQKGEWKISEPLKFDTTGTLIDGQHRLSAVVKAGVPVKFLVCKNYPAESAQYLDIGAKRTVTDVAHIRGEMVKNYEMSTTRALFIPNRAHQNGLSRISEKALIDTYNQYEKYVKFGCKLYQNKNVYSSATAAVFARALHYYTVQKPSAESVQRLNSAMTILLNGITNMENNPLILLRDYLMTEKRDRKHNPIGKTEVTDYYLNLYVRRIPRQKFTYPKNYTLVYDIPQLASVNKA